MSISQLLPVAVSPPVTGNAVGIHHVNVGIAITERMKGDTATVRRPGREPVLTWMIRSIQQARAVGVHNPNFIIARTVRNECDLPAIGRPGCRTVVRRVIRQVRYAKVIDVNDVDLSIAITKGLEQYARTIR